jgi:DNA polymerase-3 subunit delta'
MESFNWPVVGHGKIQQILQKGLLNNKLAHAYLFSGPAHLGKSLVAEKFIASILCHDYQQQNKSQVKSLPCNECVFCQQFAKGIHPDIYNLKKEEDKKNISVEQVREMQKFLSLTSFLNSYKIAIIENAQDLSESAQNALLKVLEEPSPKTILILLVNDANFLLPTISSRCQLIKFRPLAEDDIFHHLISLGSSREQAKNLTALAGGQIGLALDYLRKPELFEAYQDKMNQTLEFFNQDLGARFKNIENILGGKKGTDSSKAVLEELDYWQLILRDILFAKNNLDNLQVNLNFQANIRNIAQKYSTRKILSLLSQVRQIKKYLTYNINPRLAVENLLINL